MAQGDGVDDMKLVIVSKTPLRISITAMATNKRLATLETILVPVRPSHFVSGSENQKTMPAMPMFAIVAKAVTNLP